MTVDVELAGALPQGARPDLSVDGTIDLDRMKDVLYVGRPAFGNENSTISLFKLSAGWQDGGAGSGEGRTGVGEQHSGDRRIAGRRYRDSVGHEPMGQHGSDSSGLAQLTKRKREAMTSNGDDYSD